MKQNKILFGYSTSGEGKRERVADQKPIFHLDCLKKKKRKRKRRKRKKPFTDHTALQTAEPGVELLLGSGSESGLRHAGVGGWSRQARSKVHTCQLRLLPRPELQVFASETLDRTRSLDCRETLVTNSDTRRNSDHDDFSQGRVKVSRVLVKPA